MDAIKSYRSPKVEVRNKSKIAGRGIFAKTKIRKGEVIAIKNGYILTKKEFNELSFECKQYCLQIEDKFFLGPKNKSETQENAININHSCEPNIGFSGTNVYVSMRDINPNEELTHDYAMCFTDMKHFSDINCNCGSKNCRKKLKSDDWKNKKLQRKYKGYFAAFIQKRI